LEERIHQVTVLKPELAALNMGSMNYAKYSSTRKAMIFDLVFANPFSEIIFMLERMNEVGVKPECECFDTGHIGSIEPLIDMGLLAPPIQFSLILGVLGGAPPEPRTLEHMSSLLPTPNTWEVIGIGRQQWRLVTAAVALGGNVRVGLEDNFYLPTGSMASSNGDLAAAAVSVVENAGRVVAEPSTARALLGLDDPPDRSAIPEHPASAKEASGR